MSSQEISPFYSIYYKVTVAQETVMKPENHLAYELQGQPLGEMLGGNKRH